MRFCQKMCTRPPRCLVAPPTTLSAERKRVSNHTELAATSPALRTVQETANVFPKATEGGAEKLSTTRSGAATADGALDGAPASKSAMSLDLSSRAADAGSDSG